MNYARYKRGETKENHAGRNHEYWRRASKALFKVTESAYNTPPPLGSPNPIRVTFTL